MFSSQFLWAKCSEICTPPFVSHSRTKLGTCEEAGLCGQSPQTCLVVPSSGCPEQPWASGNSAKWPWWQGEGQLACGPSSLSGMWAAQCKGDVRVCSSSCMCSVWAPLHAGAPRVGLKHGEQAHVGLICNLWVQVVLWELAVQLDPSHKSTLFCYLGVAGRSCSIFRNVLHLHIWLRNNSTLGRGAQMYCISKLASCFREVVLRCFKDSCVWLQSPPRLNAFRFSQNCCLVCPLVQYCFFLQLLVE